MDIVTNQETSNVEKWERAGVEGRILDRFRERAVEHLPALGARRVLDAGCGEGYFTAALVAALPAAEVTGVEADQRALAAFRRRNPGARAQRGDLYRLPFDDGAFDLVTCTEVLEHLEHPDAVLRELRRVVSPGGHVLVTVPHEPFFRAGNFVRGRYLRRLGSTPGHVSTWSRWGLRRLVAAELDVVRWVNLFPWQGVLARRP